jgi:hypothetical protein
MGVHRHNGGGWAPARATYTLYAKNIYLGGPPIWLRARAIWRRTGGAWHPATAGYEAAADIASISAQTLWKTDSGGTGPLDPAGGDNGYWESSVRVTTGPNCGSYALWFFDLNGEAGLWQFAGSYSPGQPPHVITNGSAGLNPVHWCATAWSGGSPDAYSLPAGQQGFSCFAYG